MKIFLNRKSVSGPWGGGNKTLRLLEEAIKNRGHLLINDLQPDIDIIFCYDPRPGLNGLWYEDFIKYKTTYRNCKIIQRVGDVGTHSKPELTALLKEIVRIKTTDHFIFPSEWARRMIDHNDANYTVIPNRSLKDFFNFRSTDTSRTSDDLKIVTHHWSQNKKKGFSLYEKLGEKINQKLKINGKNVSFTYIGRYSNNFSKSGLEVKSPLSADDLSEELSKYDVYLTASVEEAGANHVLEAMAAGLPILYNDKGGSIDEYCKEYGTIYSSLEDLIEKLSDIDNHYHLYKEKVLKYNQCASQSISEYLDLIEAVK